MLIMKKVHIYANYLLLALVMDAYKIRHILIMEDCSSLKHF